MHPPMTRNQNRITRAVLTTVVIIAASLGCSAAGSATAGHGEPLLALADVAAQRVQLEPGSR